MVLEESKAEYMKPGEMDERLYRDVFPLPLLNQISSQLKQKNKKVLICFVIGLAQLTGDLYTLKSDSQSIGYAIVFLEDYKEIKPGTVILKNNNFSEESKEEIRSMLDENGMKKKVLILYRANKLPTIYSSIESRLNYGKKIREIFNTVKTEKYDCIQKHLGLCDILGKGSYGNVYKFNNSPFHCLMCAIKISKLKSGSMMEKRTSSWHEVYILENIIRPILQSEINQNLPLLYDYFTCKKCNIVTDGNNVKTPCVVTIVELASGNLRNYIQSKPSIEELHSALFQIMAGMHAIQMHGQILNFDIKKENILFYDVDKKKVPFFSYKIFGNNYKVPNYGKLFIVNDFGISRPMSPLHPLYKTETDTTFRLGSRYAVIKDGKFVPFNTKKYLDQDEKMVNSPRIVWISDNGRDPEKGFEKGSEKNADEIKEVRKPIRKYSRGGEFRLFRENGKVAKLNVELSRDVKNYLKGLGIDTDPSSYDFFLHPDVIPPFEFYNDTQDVIRMFIGGKRTTQRGNHRVCPEIPTKLIEELKPYIGIGESMKDKKFSTPREVLAGYFILDFFKEYRV